MSDDAPLPKLPSRNHGGARPNTGPKKGSKHKATIEREKADKAALEIEAAKQAGRKLARDVLDEFMMVFQGMAAQHQPVEGNRNANEEKFRYYSKACVECATQLAQYQTPKLRAILVPNAPPDPHGRLPTIITVDVFDEKNRPLRDVTPVKIKARA